MPLPGRSGQAYRRDTSAKRPPWRRLPVQVAELARKAGEVTSIPLVDLAAQHAAVAEEIAEGWRDVLARTSFIAGPQVAAFESEYAAFVGARHCVGMANGTDAIESALPALGVGAGDEGILPPTSSVSRP